MTNHVVYTLSDPRTGHIRYVGKTSAGLISRVRAHMAPSQRKRRTIKNAWLNELVALGLRPCAEALEECVSSSELADAERFHIAYWGYIGAALTNSTAGGDGCVNGDATRAKISASKQGTVVSAATRAKISAANSNPSAATRERQAAAKRGLRATIETRARMARAQAGRSPTDATRERLCAAQRRRAMPIEDSAGRRYATQHDAARALGVSVSNVNRALRFPGRTVGGYSFKRVSHG